MFHSWAEERLSKTTMRFTSNVASAFTRFVPMEPAPPVTSTVLRRKVSERSLTSLRRTILALHPFHGSSDAFLRGDLRVVLKIPDCLRAVHRFYLRGEGLRVLVGDDGIVAACNLKDEVGVGLDVSLPLEQARDVVKFTWREIIHIVTESRAEDYDVV